MSPSVNGCSIVNNILSCSFGDLASGDSRTVHITSPTTNGSCGEYPNTARADASNHDVVAASDITAVTGCETFCTATQGGWGQDANGNNIGSLRDTYFSTVFPSGLVVGGAKTITLTSAAAVNAYLPAGGTPKKLTKNHSNPTKTESGVFGGQVTALKLNVAFSNAGVGGWQPSLSSAVVTVGPSAIVGMTVTQVLALAESVLGGGSLPSGVSISDLNSVVSRINEMSSPDGCTFGNGTVQ
jgi:hypothetical protein